MEDAAPNDNVQTRRSALSEINDSLTQTPKSASPDEMVIIQRGPRCKPETWSPFEFDRTNILGPSKDKTPEKVPRARREISSKLRRRLNLSPDKRDGLGEELAKRLRLLPRLSERDK